MPSQIDLINFTTPFGRATRQETLNSKSPQNTFPVLVIVFSAIVISGLSGLRFRGTKNFHTV